MPDAASRPRLARLHLGLALAVVLCSSAFVIEVLRALGGNTLSWAYVFEWPILLAYGVYMWQRLVREERQASTSAPMTTAPMDAPSEEDEADRVAYNQYLAELHAADGADRRSERGPAAAS